MRKKHLLAIGIAILILLTAVGSIVQSNNAPINVNVIYMAEREVSDISLIPGTLWFSQETVIHNDTQLGKVEEVYVKEGDSVKKGTPLIQYSNEEISLEEDRNQLSIESSYLKINNLQDQLNELERKESELIKQIGRVEAGKQVEAERAQLYVEKKMADIEARTYLLEKEALKKKQNKLKVVGNMEGTVISVNKNSADSPNVDTPILHIADTSNLVVKGVISEFDSLEIQKGQPVKISTDVIPDQSWNGVVTKIGTMPSQNSLSNEQETLITYPIEVKVKNDIPVKPGFKMIMEIETERREAYAIPWSAVKTDEKNGYFVWVVDKEILKKNYIEIGSTYDEYVKVVSGLKLEDKVVNNPAKELEEGMEVKSND
ncbi:efflux RND transporter periplasmic adaptor subunit [Rossellomorea sp. AcN35-11]|nr:efflux RND transporter periplasmic adaptor subunit [Rossellomorea aquimaris]WJV30838.1 efflux RND transporter periplasmic adaptor subunit [Rossellomorea sp. AcN35-11]